MFESGLGRALALIVVIFAANACDKKAADAPPPRGLPPIDPSAAVAPSPTDRPVHPPTAGEALPPGHEGPHAGQEGMPPGHPAIDPKEATPADVPFDPKSVIAGTLVLDPKLKDAAATGDVIFLVARGAGEAGAPGPVLAVKRASAD